MILLLGCSPGEAIKPDPITAPRRTTQGGNPGDACTDAGGDTGRLAADSTCCTEGCLDAQFACHAVTRINSASYTTEPGKCGHHGGACVDCEDNNPCTDDVCAEKGCTHYNWTHEKACTVGAASGFCDTASAQCCTTNTNVNCCKGCVSQGACVATCPGNQVCNPRTTKCE
jgi:hypothetical protein